MKVILLCGKNLVFFCVCVFRLRMLSEESVPQADSVLAALAKHLEVKLSFGEIQTHFITRSDRLKCTC